MLRLSPTDMARARLQGADLGRPALGRAPGDPGLCATSRPVSNLRDSHRAGRVRGGPRPHDAPVAPVDWRGLSVDADVACGRAPRGELEQSPASGASVFERMGSDAAETPAAPPGRG